MKSTIVRLINIEELGSGMLDDTAIQRTGDLVSSLGTQIEKIDDKISQLESRIKYKRSLI